ncbi:MAG: MlaC/ttg2D family ABC transporter substrate-binding protein, partial [Gemmatimonadota bacterium]
AVFPLSMAVPFAGRLVAGWYANLQLGGNFRPARCTNTVHMQGLSSQRIRGRIVTRILQGGHMNLARISGFILALAFTSAFAQELKPEDLVKRVTEDVLAAIKSDKALQAGDRQKALALAEQKVMPHIDFAEATKLAVGRAWSSATPEQQKKLVDEFRAMLVRIYSNAIDVYRGQTMRVQPVNTPAGATETAVRNQYIRPGQPPVSVDYAMRKTPEGWKIYDITVEGMSLVLTYRGEFEQVMRQSGVEGLLKRLAEKNTPPTSRSG